MLLLPLFFFFFVGVLNVYVGNFHPGGCCVNTRLGSRLLIQFFFSKCGLYFKRRIPHLCCVTCDNISLLQALITAFFPSPECYFNFQIEYLFLRRGMMVCFFPLLLLLFRNYIYSLSERGWSSIIVSNVVFISWMEYIGKCVRAGKTAECECGILNKTNLRTPPKAFKSNWKPWCYNGIYLVAKWLC